MNLKVESVTRADLDEFIKLQWAAFEPVEVDMILPMVYPNGPEADFMERRRQRLLAETGDALGSLCFCVKDPASGRIMAISHWETNLNPLRSRVDIDAEFDQRKRAHFGAPPVEGMNMELFLAFFKASFYSEYEATLGRPYVCLRVLAAHPEFDRKGAGSLLLKHGLERADQRDLPVFLDAGWVGKPLYERYGFKVVKDLPFDGTHHGGRSPGRHWCMLRSAKSDRDHAIVTS